MCLRSIVVAACGALLAASVVAAQRNAAPVPTPEQEKVGVAITMQVAGAPYQFTGKASCTHEAKGYIYGTAAQMWTVEQSEGQRSLHFTFWRPGGGAPDMFTLNVSTGQKPHSVSTVKGAAGGVVSGSGLVKLATAAASGTFAIDATTAGGVKISGTIKCDAFKAAKAEGGY